MSWRELACCRMADRDAREPRALASVESRASLRTGTRRKNERECARDEVRPAAALPWLPLHSWLRRYKSMGLRGMFSVEAYSVIVVSHPSISLRRKRLFFCVLDVHMCIANRPVRRHVAKHAPLWQFAARSRVWVVVSVLRVSPRTGGVDNGCSPQSCENESIVRENVSWQWHRKTYRAVLYGTNSARPLSQTLSD